MIRFIIRRLLQALPTVLLITLFCYALMYFAPGGPTAMLAENPGLRPEDIAQIRHNFGLDQPWYVQYGKWLSRLALHQDLGRSYVTQQPVGAMIWQRLPATLELMVSAFALSCLVGGLTGIAAALRPGQWFDRLSGVVAAIGLSIPNFWLGILLILFFSVHLGWLPSAGREPVTGAVDMGTSIRHLILPTVVLSFSYIAAWSRYVRSGLLEVLSQDFIRTARAKGLRESQILFRHALRNALLPVITVIGAQVPTWFTGAVITETIFAWPGIGRLFYEGILYHDYPRLMGILLVTALLVVLCNLLVDILYEALDPRVGRPA